MAFEKLKLAFKDRFMPWNLTTAKKVEEALESGSLPDTTSASAGQVLKLDSDKKPEWGDAGGSGVTVLECTENDGTYTVPMKASELFEAFKSGVVILKVNADILYYELIRDVQYVEGGVEFIYKFDTTLTDEIMASSGDDYPTFTV